MKERTQIFVSAAIAIPLNLIIVGWHYTPYWTNALCTYICIASTLWFFVVAYIALFAKIKASNG
jgi:hypothetical protein